MSQRATPFFCPFCGEQDIRPAEEEGFWHCELCDRLWSVKFKGLATEHGSGTLP